jgi:hypothetical protein
VDDILDKSVQHITQQSYDEDHGDNGNGKATVHEKPNISSEAKVSLDDIDTPKKSFPTECSDTSPSEETSFLKTSKDIQQEIKVLGKLETIDSNLNNLPNLITKTESGGTSKTTSHLTEGSEEKSTFLKSSKNIQQEIEVLGKLETIHSNVNSLSKSVVETYHFNENTQSDKSKEDFAAENVSQSIGEPQQKEEIPLDEEILEIKEWTYETIASPVSTLVAEKYIQEIVGEEHQKQNSLNSNEKVNELKEDGITSSVKDFVASKVIEEISEEVQELARETQHTEEQDDIQLHDAQEVRNDGNNSTLIEDIACEPYEQEEIPGGGVQQVEKWENESAASSVQDFVAAKVIQELDRKPNEKEDSPSESVQEDNELKDESIASSVDNFVAAKAIKELDIKSPSKKEREGSPSVGAQEDNESKDVSMACSVEDFVAAKVIKEIELETQPDEEVNKGPEKVIQKIKVEAQCKSPFEGDQEVIELRDKSIVSSVEDFVEAKLIPEIDRDPLPKEESEGSRSEGAQNDNELKDKSIASSVKDFVSAKVIQEIYQEAQPKEEGNEGPLESTREIKDLIFDNVSSLVEDLVTVKIVRKLTEENTEATREKYVKHDVLNDGAPDNVTSGKDQQIVEMLPEGDELQRDESSNEEFDFVQTDVQDQYENVFTGTDVLNGESYHKRDIEQSYFDRKSDMTSEIEALANSHRQSAVETAITMSSNTLPETPAAGKPRKLSKSHFLTAVEVAHGHHLLRKRSLSKTETNPIDQSKIDPPPKINPPHSKVSEIEVLPEITDGAVSNTVAKSSSRKGLQVASRQRFRQLVEEVIRTKMSPGMS